MPTKENKMTEQKNTLLGYATDNLKLATYLMSREDVKFSHMHVNTSKKKVIIDVVFDAKGTTDQMESMAVFDKHIADYHNDADCSEMPARQVLAKYEEMKQLVNSEIRRYRQSERQNKNGNENSKR